MNKKSARNWIIIGLIAAALMEATAYSLLAISYAKAVRIVDEQRKVINEYILPTPTTPKSDHKIVTW